MGGSSGGGEQTQEAVPWSGVQPYMLDMLQDAQGLYNQGGPGYYPGQTFAGRDPLSDQAQNLKLNYAMNSMPGQIYDSQRALSSALNAPDAANNPYVQNMMQSNQFMANRNLSENLLPRISSGAVAGGQKGGSREGIAQGLAMRGTQEGLMNANNSLMMDAYGKGLGAQQGALSMSPGIMNMGMAPMDVMSGVGAYNTGIDSQALNADMDRWNYNQNLPWQTANNYSSLLQGNNQWGAISEGGGGGTSPLAGAMGGAALGSAVGTGLGAAGGAAAGTSVMPGWGTAIGAGLGLLGAI